MRIEQESLLLTKMLSHFVTTGVGARGRPMSAALLALLLSLSVAEPASAQVVELDERTNEVVQAAGEFAGKVPYAGPVLSFATKLIFSAKAELSWAEKEALLKAYADKRINEKKVDQLSDILAGYRALIIQLDETTADESAEDARHRQNYGQGISMDKRRAYHDQRIAMWKQLNAAVLLDLQLFVSDEDEPAYLLLPLLGAATNLRLVAIERLVALVSHHDHNAAAVFKKLLTKDRDRPEDRTVIEDYNAILETEIAKAAKEHASQVKMHSQGIPKVNRDFWVCDDEEKVTVSKLFHGTAEYREAGSQLGYKQSYEAPKEHAFGTCSVCKGGDGKGRLQDWGNLRAPYGCVSGISIATAKKMAEALVVQRAKQIRDDDIHRNRVLYLLGETVVLKVSMIDPKVTDEQFYKIFYPAKHIGLVHENGSGLYKVWEYDAQDPARKNNDFGPEWHSAGYGYVECDATAARSFLSYWNSPAGHAKARGETGLKHKITSGKKLIVEEERFFNPWTWRWRYERVKFSD